MGKAIVVDITKCIGCSDCETPCKNQSLDQKLGPCVNQPEIGWFNICVKGADEKRSSKVTLAYKNPICQQCKKVLCIKNCQSKAISKQKEGTVFIDPLKCFKQTHCFPVCPYGIIHFGKDPDSFLDNRWCEHSLERKWKEPSCLDACPTLIFSLREENELKRKVNTKTLASEAKINLKTYIIN